MRKVIVLSAAAILLLTALGASAQTGTWTAVGSTGTVDPTQVSLFGVFTGTQLGFAAAGNPGSIVARFNVTNTYGGGLRDTPPWTTLEVGAINSTLDFGPTDIDGGAVMLPITITNTSADASLDLSGFTKTASAVYSVTLPPGTTTLAPGMQLVLNVSYHPTVEKPAGQLDSMTVTNNIAGATGVCASCTFANTTFNFLNNLYYVEVTITRTSGAGTPLLSTLRIR